MVITILSNVLINMRHQGGRLPYTRGGGGGGVAGPAHWWRDYIWT